MAVQDYDLAFSLGFSCGCTQALREAGLQFASYPFDWVGAPGLLASVRMLETDFADWMEKGDLELYDVRRAPLFSQVYRNARTHFGFPHDFSSFRGFEDSYQSVRDRYDRRIKRLLESIAANRRVLAVYIERVIDKRISDAELKEAHRRLSDKFPGSAFEILYFFQEDGCAMPRDCEIAPGITAVAVDYRRMESGETIHEVNRAPVTAYLKEHVFVRDRRNEADTSAYRDSRRRWREKRWGDASLFRRIFNEFAYKLYRRLERRLSVSGVIPREHPLWF